MGESTHTWRRVTGMSDLPDMLVPPSKAVILASVPRRMCRTPDQRTFLRTLKEDADVLDLRCDGYANLMLVARDIVWHMNWETKTSRPTIDGIVKRTGLSKPTVKRWVRWLRERGWLGVVQQGRASETLGNRAAVWVLCVPRRSVRNRRVYDHHKRDQESQGQASDQREQTSEPLTVSSRREETDYPTHARERRSPSRPGRPRISPTWGLHATPRTKRDRLSMCERLRQESPVLRLMTPWYLRWLLKPIIDAGGTAADVLHGLDVREDDSRWTYAWQSAREIRHPAGWVRHRLSAWIGADGQVLPLPSQRRAAADARRRAEQEARRREWERMRSAVGWLDSPRPATHAEDAAVAGFETVVAPAGRAVGPNEEFRRVRAEMERRRVRDAAELEMLVVRRSGRAS